MTTLNEISYFIAGRLDKSHDDKLVREIAFAVKYWRAFLIRQDIEKNARSPLYQQKVILGLQTVDSSDNCYVEGDCLVLRTTIQVPEFIRTKSRSPLQYVGTDDNRIPFSYITFARLPYQSSSKFTGKKIFYTFYNGYIYVYNTLKLDYIAVSAAFVDPVQAGEVCIDVVDCADNDAPFFTPGDMLKTIIEGILSGTFSITNHSDLEANVV